MRRRNNGAGKRAYEKDQHPPRQWNKWGKSGRYDAPPKANRFELAHGLESGDSYLATLHGRARPLSPEQRLLLACLADALRSLRDSYNARDTPHGRTIWREQCRWFTDDSSDHLFRFVVVCDHLEIDRSYLLRYAERWLK